MRGLLLLNFVICYLSVTANSSEDDFTCIAGNFTTGLSGNVTCHFGPNVHNTGYHFEIVRYPYNAPSSHSGEDVLRCHRLGNELRCTTGKGFVFNKNIQDNLTVSIPKVTVDQAGRYACQLIPPDDRKKRLCDLNVKEVEVASSIFSEDTSSKTILVLAVLVGLLPPLCCLVILYLLCRNRTKKIRQKLPCFNRDRSGGKANKDTKGSQLDDDDAKVRQPFIMVPIRPYTDSDLVDEREEEIQNTKFDGDDEDASREPFIIHIVPFNETEETQQEDNTEQTKKLQPPRPCRPYREAYRRDAYTAPVEPLKDSVSENGNGFIAPRSVEEETQHNAQNATSGQEMFSMPSILPFEKLDDIHKTDQGPPQNVKMTETALRRPKKT